MGAAYQTEAFGSIGKAIYPPACYKKRDKRQGKIEPNTHNEIGVDGASGSIKLLIHPNAGKCVGVKRSKIDAIMKRQ